MATGAKQHVVPQIYLRAFCDSTPLKGVDPRKYTPSLWVLPRSLLEKPRRAAPRNVAWARNVYTLRDDDPKYPWLEVALSRLESHFAPVMRRVLSKDALSLEDRTTLALFVGALHERTLGMLEQRQEFWNELVHITRQMQRADPERGQDALNEAARGVFWERFGEEAKRQIAIGAEAFAKVTGAQAFLIENRARLPFVTSDSPVSYRQLHADELLAATMPAEWLFEGIPRSAKHFFVFCPLSPRHAYVSSEFFPPNPHFVRRVTDSDVLVLAMNELTRESADKELFSSVADPYGQWRVLALKHEARIRAHIESRPSGLNIYTSNDRYWLPTTDVEHGMGEHPLIGRLTFRSPDLRTLRAIANDGDITLVEIVREGQDGGGLRNAWFVSVALDESSYSTIENGPFRERPVRG